MLKIDFQMISAIVTVLALIIDLVIRWPTLVERFSKATIISKLFVGILAGSVIGLGIAEITGRMYYFLLIAMGTGLGWLVWPSLNALLATHRFLWAVSGSVLGVIGHSRGFLFSSSLSERIEPLQPKAEIASGPAGEFVQRKANRRVSR